MTHTESQDLLLDLAYGELDPVRARELEGHLAGCDECQREKAALDEARRLTAPLREMEEPPHGFDEKILEAARAQAQIEHGTVGQVIEVEGVVRPLDLEAARIDAHGPVAARQERRKPRWAIRIALGGSVAAAATLALVVSTTLQRSRQAELAKAAASDKDAYRIRVGEPQPVSQPENEPARAAPRPAQVHFAPQPTERRAEGVLKRKGPIDGANGRGSGGDALDSAAPAGNVAQQTGGPGQSGGGVQQLAGSADGKQVAGEKKAVVAAREQDQQKPPEPAPAAKEQPRVAVVENRAAPKAEEPDGVEAAPAPKTVPMMAQAPAAALRAPPSAVASAAADDRSAAQLEAAAQEARHAGNYALAASLYEKAAALRREARDQAESPAWDLAHAVECYATAGLFEEALRVRDQLAKMYPSEKTAFSAAARATRSGEGVPAATDQKGPSSKQPAKAKAEPEQAKPSDF